MDDEDSLLGEGVGCMIDPKKVAKAVVQSQDLHRRLLSTQYFKHWNGKKTLPEGEGNDA